MKRFFFFPLVVIILSACGSSPEAPQVSPAVLSQTESIDIETPQLTPENEPKELSPPEHRIGIRKVNGTGEFYNRETGQKFVPRGVNYVFVPSQGRYSNLTLKVGVYDPDIVREDFQQLADAGYNTVRVFLDHCNAGPGCIGDADNQGLNPRYLDNIADMLEAAADADLFILFTSNDLPDQGGYAEKANASSGGNFAGYRNSYYLTPEAVSATRDYWRDLISGLIDREAATDRVLGWQLLNEQWMFLDQPPLSLTEGQVTTTTGTYNMGKPEEKQRMVSEGLIHYIEEVKAEIILHDPSALVTMGFFVPELVAPGWYVETASLLEGSDLDFFDFHAYPGDHTLAEHAQAFGMLGFEEKPIILGEYGPFRNIYPDLIPAAREVTAWQAESCQFGFDGWLYWSYYPANSNVNDRTWGFTDQEGYFFDLLAPVNLPDPCQEVAIASPNLAYQKPVRVSSVLPEEPGSNAVDENGSTQWGAGADAPQWIEIDLESPHLISEIRLLVAQWPAGPTEHTVRGRTATGTWIEIHTFREETEQGDWLIHSLPEGLEDIQALRVETRSSPSWVAWGEVQILGE